MRKQAVKITEMIIRIALVFISVSMIYWYIISRIVNIGSVIGTLFFTWIGLNGIFWGKIRQAVRKMKQKRSTKIIYRIVCILFALLFLWIGLILGAMVYFARKAPSDNATVVVLGCQVRGNTPSLMLSKRIDAAYDYLVLHPDAKCVVSGGQGTGENISEAECMRNALVTMGIDENRIYMEDRSVNTKENIAFSAEVIQKYGLNENMAIVTDGFHEMRAAIIASRLGYSCGAVSAHTPTYISANFTTREMIAVTASLLLNR